MSVHVGISPLRRRRQELRDGADRLDDGLDQATACLLLFYAAECGMKAQWLKRRGLRDTSALPKKFQHDLRTLAKALSLPNHLWEKLGRCRRADQDNAPVDVHRLHEAWRYGAKLRTADDKEANTALRALVAWCEKD